MSIGRRRLAALAAGGLTVGTLIAGTAGTANATLVPRAHTISGSASINIIDDEDWPLNDEVGWHSVSLGTAKVAYGSPVSWSFSRCTGDEVVAAYKVTAALQMDGDVTFDVSSRLYEGASCSTTDLDGSTGGSYRVERHESMSSVLFNRNMDENSGDTTVLYLNMQSA